MKVDQLLSILYDTSVLDSEGDIDDGVFKILNPELYQDTLWRLVGAHKLSAYILKTLNWRDEYSIDQCISVLQKFAKHNAELSDRSTEFSRMFNCMNDPVNDMIDILRGMS